ncbi:hypothetical protein SNE40_003724 [Patella caerulea]|uniref:Uncharacterized protein n=1 Tax=Patella caerulea TaxID=87958 RepID=A0AAN8Q5P0_PATCE
MESESKHRNQRVRRRERAQLLQQGKQSQVREMGDEIDESPPRTSKDKGRGKPRRRRNSSPNIFEEDIIDGFAIMSFKTFEDLEVSYTIFIFVHIEPVGSNTALLSTKTTQRVDNIYF